MFWDISRSAGSNANLSAFLAGFALTAMTLVLVRFGETSGTAALPATHKHWWFKGSATQPLPVLRDVTAEAGANVLRLLLVAFITLIVAAIEWGVLSAQPPLPSLSTGSTQSTIDACFVTGLCQLTKATDSLLASACVALTAVGALALVAAMGDLIVYRYDAEGYIYVTLRRAYSGVTILAAYEMASFVWESLRDLSVKIPQAGTPIYPTWAGTKANTFAPMAVAIAVGFAVHLPYGRTLGRRIVAIRRSLRKQDPAAAPGRVTRAFFALFSLPSVAGATCLLAVVTAAVLPFTHYADKTVLLSSDYLKASAVLSVLCALSAASFVIVAGWMLGENAHLVGRTGQEAS